MTSDLITKKPTLGPLQCDHCTRIWYGSFKRGGEKWTPDGATLCLNCWSELDEYLYRHFPERYNLSWAFMKPEDIPFIHEQGRKWIADKNRKPLAPKNIYRGGGVPQWMQRAIEKGLVKTNGEDVYIITVRAADNEPVSVDVSQDHSVLRRHRWEKGRP